MILIFAVTFTAACSSLRFPGVYRIDIPQGNIITNENVDKLKTGMTARQVEFVMGTAMVKDPFHPDRWDYFYHLETGKGEITQNHLTLYFDKDTLVRIDKSLYDASKATPSATEARMKKATELKDRSLPGDRDAVPQR